MSNSTVTSLKPRKGTGQVVTIGASSSRTLNPVNSGVTSVRIAVDQDCYVAFGDGNVEATAQDEFWFAGLVEYKPVTQGEHVAVLQVSQGGNMYVIEETR